MRKILLLVLLLASGCAQWVEVGGLYKNESNNYSVELPQGWMRWNKGDQLFITRDGAPLQYVRVFRQDVDKPLPNTKKKFSKTMLPQEVSEVLLDGIASDSTVADYSLIENGPLVISGIPGFKAIYAYRTEDGLRIKTVYCGFIRDEWFYGIHYTAPKRYYFDKDVQTFEKILESFRLIKTP